MAVVIPIPQDQNGNVVPFFNEVVTLDNVTFILEFYWNTRAQAWYLQLYDAESNLLVAGRRLVVGHPVFWRLFMLPGMPLGSIFPIDSSNQDLDPALQDLGVRVPIIYGTAADVLAAIGG